SDEETVHLTVEDNGPGIPDDIIDRIFDPFFSGSETGLGMGLGLTITQNIVSDMQGTLTVRNQPKGGAVFTASFPRLRELE
ncbi:hypothetical protein GF324_05685, partial [bacterium]|nr:hypothetical protein [bacterium]